MYEAVFLFANMKIYAIAAFAALTAIPTLVGMSIVNGPVGLAAYYNAVKTSLDAVFKEILDPLYGLTSAAADNHIYLYFAAFLSAIHALHSLTEGRFQHSAEPLGEYLRGRRSSIT